MNYKMIGRILALILAVEAIFMIPAFLICVADGDRAAAHAFLLSMAAIGLVSLLLHLLSRRADRRFYAKEGLVCVGGGWVVMSLLGCLPFVLSGAIPSFINALFEIVSGFTTTGASILTDIESLPRGILYWRSFSHWLGGMGVLVFVLAVMPDGGHSGGFTLHLLRAESPGPEVSKLVPRIKRTAMILYLIYIVLTVLNVLFLLAGGMSLFDALCTAFGCAGTGGFGVRNDSIAGYSTYIQSVCTVFMLLFGINFSCYYLILCRRWRSIRHDEELRLYLGVLFAATLLIALNIRSGYADMGGAVHDAAFQVTSIMTTTGYATANFDLWPSFSKALLLILMVFGACGGSTGGGIKCGRVLLMLKSLRRNIQQILHPNKVQVVRLNGHVVDERVISSTSAYLVAYVVIILLSFLVLSLDNFSSTTNFTAVLACFNNIGPGLESVGPVCNYSGFSVLSKLVLIADMLAGRLEIFPILVMLSRNTWRRH